MAAAAAAPARPMNVLVILIDDHKADLHDVFNATSPVPPPNMRRLAARGTWFSRGYVDAPACGPSRTALLTGVHATKSGVYYNSHACRRAPGWISGVETLPGRFLRAGYRTAHFGKIAHNRFPLESIEIPAGYRGDDLEALPKPARWLATHRGEHDYIVKHGLWKKALQAKYASTAYVDGQIGRVLDALEAGPNNDNTIIVFASDNGWHTGEKNHWAKFYLSEMANRVVFAIAVPGMKPQVSTTPVGLIDGYPTLAALCGLPPPAHALDGVNLAPILRGETRDRGRPVLSTYGPGCHSLRDERFRYTRYRDGSEELYDHQYDPHEWTNLAADPRCAAAKARLAAHFPAVNAAPVIHRGATKSEGDSNGWEDEAFN